MAEPGVPDEYCKSSIKGLVKEKDYKVSLSSSLSNNFLTCTAKYEFFKSFRNRNLEFDLNEDLYTGNNLVLDENNNPVYVTTGVYKIEEFHRSNSLAEASGENICILCIVFYSILTFLCILYAYLKRDNFLKWLWLYVTHCIHIFCFLISMDMEMPINLRTFMLCHYKRYIHWLGSIR